MVCIWNENTKINFKKLSKNYITSFAYPQTKSQLETKIKLEKWQPDLYYFGVRNKLILESTWKELTSQRKICWSCCQNTENLVSNVTYNFEI